MAKAKKLPSGNWRVLVYAGVDAGGKRKYESFTAETKSEAEYLASEYKLKRYTRSSMTLKEAFDSYIDSKSSILSPSTIREYKNTRKNHYQKLMPKCIKDITNNDIQIEINNISARLSPKTVQNIHSLLSSVLKMFRPDFILTTSLPEKVKKEIFIPEKKTMKRLIKLAEGESVEIPMLLAVTAGLRASEINGLTYECIDRKNKELLIKQASVRGEHGNVIKVPKSYSGYRRISVSDKLISKLGDGQPQDFVVGLTSSAIEKLWRKFLLNHNEEHFNFHALRHYFCSEALLLGIPKKYVAEIMGHSSEQMIDRVYAHTFKDEKQQFGLKIVETMDNILDSSE